MNLKDEYEFVCPRCGEINLTEPILNMRIGHNSGYASCYNCKEFLYIEISNDDKMIAMEYNEHLEVLRNLIKEELL